MDEARGGVLFIDEAYGLNPSNSHFAKDSLEMLLANMTDRKYEGNMVIILAGYQNDMEALLQSNPGLKRRITERLDFQAWSPQHCVSLLHKLIEEDDCELPHEFDTMISDLFLDLSSRDGWGNAGDVITIHGKMESARIYRGDDFGNVDESYVENDIKTAFNLMFNQRQHSNVSNLAELTNMRPVVSVPMANPFMEIVNEIDIQLHGPQISEVDYDLLDEEMQESDPSDDDLFSALDEALKSTGYEDLYEVRGILTTQQIPVEVVDYVSNKLIRPSQKVRVMLVRQCPLLLDRIQALITDIERELDYQRLLQEEIRKADAIMKEKLKEEERLRQKELEMERVRQIGRCPMSFEWLPCGDGYRCAGGSHYVSKSQINYV